MTTKPSCREVLDLVIGHYGITINEAIEIMRTPLYPRELRDEFAGQAMAALTHQAPSSQDLIEAIDALAAMSYQVADAMLKARQS